MITIRYGSRPGEKLIEKGSFICPLCHRKRQYKRYRLVKELYYGFVSIPTGDFGQYIHCQSCLRPFPPQILDSGVQLKIEIDESPLPPPNMMDIWKKAYTALSCEDLVTKKAGVVEAISPILFTMAHHLQDTGVKIRLQEYEEARRYLVTILNLGIEWQEINLRQKLELQSHTPKQHQKIMDFITFAHVLLSRLP